MASNNAVVQYASAGLLACGILSNVATSLLFQNRRSIGEVSRHNPLIWAPRDLGGGGTPGSSPIYGLMWSAIYFGAFASAICTLVATTQGSDLQGHAAAASLFNGSANACGAFLLASLWGPLFTEKKKWTFAVASVLLVTCAALALTGAIVAKPFVDAQTWWAVLQGVVLSVFAGWASVAAGLSVGITTRIYNHGIDAVVKEDDRAFSPFPLTLAVLLTVLSIVFASPLLPVPLAVASMFIKNFRKWYVWGSLAVCVVGVVGGVVMALVYRQTGVFW
jgi:hypothetical protein